MRRISSILALLAAFSASFAAAAESDVDAKIVADTTAIQPGHPFTLAIVLTPQPGWHIYWKNPGDSGLPTTVQIKAPSALAAGDLQYPVPQRIMAGADIVNYGYEGSTVFLVPMTVPADVAATPDGMHLEAVVSWLCCKEECVPGRATLELTLPVGTSTPAHEELFSKARALMPESTPPADAVKSVKPLAGALGVHIEWQTPPTHVELFPTALDGLDVSEIHPTTQGTTTTIPLNAHVMSGQTLRSQELPALVSFTDAGGRTRGFYTTIDLHALSAHASP